MGKPWPGNSCRWLFQPQNGVGVGGTEERLTALIPPKPPLIQIPHFYLCIFNGSWGQTLGFWGKSCCSSHELVAQGTPESPIHQDISLLTQGPPGWWGETLKIERWCIYIWSWGASFWYHFFLGALNVEKALLLQRIGKAFSRLQRADPEPQDTVRAAPGLVGNGSASSPFFFLCLEKALKAARAPIPPTGSS